MIEKKAAEIIKELIEENSILKTQIQEKTASELERIEKDKRQNLSNAFGGLDLNDVQGNDLEAFGKVASMIIPGDYGRLSSSSGGTSEREMAAARIEELLG